MVRSFQTNLAESTLIDVRLFSFIFILQQTLAIGYIVKLFRVDVTANWFNIIANFLWFTIRGFYAYGEKQVYWELLRR